MPAENEAVRGGGASGNKMGVRTSCQFVEEVVLRLVGSLVEFMLGCFEPEVVVRVVRGFVVVRACFIVEFVVGRGSFVVVVGERSVERAPCVGETACVWSRRGVRRRP